MKFPIILDENDVLPLILKFIQIAGEQVLDKKFAWIDRELVENQFMLEWLREYHGTEMRLRALLLTVQNGVLLRGIQDTEQYDLYSFVAGFVQIYELLSEKGQKRFKGMLYDGLKTDKGLAAVKHEVVTATHLMVRGYDVDFHDLETGSGVDYIARRDGMELEIECKVFTGDLGRKIHKRRLISLHQLLLPVLEQVFRTASKGILIRIVIPGRLTPNRDQMTKIVETVSLAVLRGEKKTHSNVCYVEVLDFAIGSSPFSVAHSEGLDQKAVARFVAGIINVPSLNPSMAMIFSPQESAVIALIQSAVPDEVLKGMKRQLRDASKGQFSGTRPGILAIHVHALSGAQLVALDGLASSDPLNPTGLRVMTSRFLESPNHKHIHTVSYQAHGRVSFDAATGSITENGVTYFILNPNNEAYGDDRCRVFARY